MVSRMRAYRTLITAGVIAAFAVTLDTQTAGADQGGISFWLPGSFGSLAATPGKPGWSFGAIYLHSSVSADGDVAASRAIHLGDRTTNLTVNLDATIDGDVDVIALAPGYTFSSPVLGGQLTANVLALAGHLRRRSTPT
jgi:hypothetical protein